MSEILVRRSWYFKKYSSSMYERHYAKRIIHNSDLLFPHYWCVEFETIVTSNDYGSRKPDLALIDKNYRYWYVVEIELENDNKTHVEEQIKVFTSAKYNEKHAEYLAKKNQNLDEKKLRALVAHEPTIIIIVPTIKDSWVRSFSPYRCEFMSIEIFENNLKEEILRLDGYKLPTNENNFISDLSYYQGLTRALKVANPGPLIDGPRNLVVKVNDELTTWKLINMGNNYLLIAEGSNNIELAPGLTYRLILEASNIYRIERK